MATKFYSTKTLERLATELLIRYQAKAGRPLTLPISAEDILDVLLGEELSSPLWDVIAEPPGHTILAGLAPEHRQIVLNEVRQQLIIGTPGLLNTTLAHEIAYWILHVDRVLIDHALLPGFPYKLHFQCDRNASSSWDEKNAHRFMSYLLMPGDLLLAQATTIDLTGWPGLYKLRERFDVTITALTLRLQDLRLVHIGPDGVVHASPPESPDQPRLF